MNYARTRRIVSALLFAGIALVPLSADPGIQIVGLGVAGFADTPESIDAVAREYRSTPTDQLFSGVEAEVWLSDRLGLGGRYVARLINFEIDPAVSAGTDNWWLDSFSDAFVSYHLFGTGSFLDPYVRYGLGIALRSDLASDAYLDANDEWTKYGESETAYDQIVNASLYQYLGVGGQINLGGLVLGVGLNYTILNTPVSDEFGRGYTVYPLERFEARLYGGIALD